ncbi:MULTISPECIES: ABC transporter permease [Actinokineospora]|uniref:Peptide ABC transporter permease n=1 Tax=Actinokineospora fastidiosa TaxID=1816 RepID=A0A918GH52_9PSEU|nr:MULTISPECIES: ABC transporter permease subunit [Actinokineospora]UVS80461.1 putative D,D-dipeptide transport system permease protein DdpC [Actinokineospora sp. UTMC 2448]GGS35505.1 peptide ABC transporter permease [Actinokineospora fastidiosa]
MRRVRPAAVLMVAVPLLLALVGPWLVPAEQARTAPFLPDGLLGTDFVGRDTWYQVLDGGRSVVLVALAATALAYAVGVPWGVTAATARLRIVDEVLMRPLDLLLAVPSLLLLIVLATVAGPGVAVLVGIVALIAFPDVARIARAAALEIGGRPALEAMRMQGESWWRTSVVYMGRSMARPLAADAGVRLTSSLYLVASASFLGVGVPPDAADWAVMVDRNRTGLFLQPWAVVVPAVLIIALSVGLNLLFDRALRKEPR